MSGCVFLKKIPDYTLTIQKIQDEVCKQENMEMRKTAISTLRTNIERISTIIVPKVIPIEFTPNFKVSVFVKKKKILYILYPQQVTERRRKVRNTWIHCSLKREWWLIYLLVGVFLPLWLPTVEGDYETKYCIIIS